MKRWGHAIVLVALGAAAACWKTKPNPTYGHDGGVDGGDAGMSGDMVVRCTGNGSCMDAAPICDSTSGECRACTASDCGSATVCDTKSGDPGFGRCVECVDDSTCNGKVCHTNTCVPCTKHTDCASTTGICDLDAGTCAPAADVIYVNNATTASCSDTQHVSSASAPYCEISAALTSSVTSTNRFVKVAGNGISATYGPIAWTTPGINLEIVGPGKDAAMGAYVLNSTGSALAVNSSSGAVSIQVDGVALEGSAAGVSCGIPSGTVAITLRDVLIHDGNDVAISSSHCTLDLERSLIARNKGGVSITGGTYDIENNLIVQNASSASPGVSFDSSSSGTFAFNTVANNTTSTTGVPGGISCGSAPKTITSSIVYGNTKTDPTTGSQLDGACQLVGTVTGVDSSQTDTSTPKFVTASDFHLQPDAGVNATCCIDIADMGPPVDVDDEKRPKGVRYDVGADEAR